MRTFDDLRADVIALFDRLLAVPVPATYPTPATSAQTADARARLLDGRLVVVVCGEFKVGKSTLLSALLDEPNLFPDNTLPQTNVVTTVSWGPVEQIIVTLRGDDGSTQTKSIGRDEIVDFVTEAGNPGNVRRVELVEICTPNPRIESGLMFVDTPGVGGVQDEHSAVTLAFLPNADALVFVTDVEKPLVAAERVFLRQAIDAARLTGELDSLLGVLTKIDQKVSYDVPFDELRDTLTDLAGQPVPVVAVSATQKLKFLATAAPQALRLSNFEQLEAELWAALHRRRIPVLLGAPLSAIGDEIAARLAPIDAAALAAQDASGRTLADLHRLATERRDHLDRLSGEGRTWPADLNAELDTAALRVQALAKGELDNNWKRFDTDYLHDSALLHQPEKIGALVGADLGVLMGSLLRIVRTEVAVTVDRFARAKAITLSAPTIAGLPDLPLPQMPEGLARLAAERRGGGAVVARNTAAVATIGAILGGAAGSVLLPGLGTWLGSELGSLIGGAVAGYLGYRSAKESQENQNREARRAEIRRVFEPRRAEQVGFVRELIVLAFRDIRPDCVTLLKDRIEAEKETTRNVLARLDIERANALAGAQTDKDGFDHERKPLWVLRDEQTRLTTEIGTGTPNAASAPAATVDDGAWADE